MVAGVAALEQNIAVNLSRIYDWAVLPLKRRVDRTAAKTRAEVLAADFRWLRAERVPENCLPWVLGYEVGWRIRSPVDVTLSPLDDVEVALSEDNEAGVRAANRAELWIRERSGLAVSRNDWLHLYQYQTAAGWSNMFIPNGRGTVEWHLGWSVSVPDGHFLLIIPDGETPTGLEVPVGILPAKLLNVPGREFSLAVKPNRLIKIERGRDLARMILLHSTSIKAKASDAEA
jgi:hypothetical protein